MTQSPDLIGVRWRRSRRSQEQGACVEIADLPGLVAVRDSKDSNGPALRFGRTAFGDLLRRTRTGQLDL
jgi:hypothetical protein